MILDKGMILCDAQTLSISGAASNMSTVLDIGKAGDAHKELFLVITCTASCTGTGTTNIQLRTHTATITTGLGTVLWQTGAVDADVVLIKGKQYKLRIPRGLKRYVALEFVNTATEAVGTFDASFVETPDTNDE